MGMKNEHQYTGRMFQTNQEAYDFFVEWTDNLPLMAGTTYKENKEFMKEVEDNIDYVKKALDYASENGITFEDFIKEFEQGELTKSFYKDYTGQEIDYKGHEQEIIYAYAKYIHGIVGRIKQQEYQERLERKLQYDAKAREIARTTTLFTTTSVAKCFKMSAVRLNALLIDERLVEKGEKSNRLFPTDNLKSEYYVEVPFSNYNYSGYQLKWTEAGVKYITNLLKAKGYEQVDLLPCQPKLEVVK